MTGSKQAGIFGGKLAAFIKSRTTPTDYNINDGMRYWQDRLLLIFLIFGTFAGFFVYLPSVALSIKESLWSVAIVDTIIYGWIVILFFNRSFSFQVRAVSLCLIGYILGMVLLLTIGPFGGGPLWLFAFPVIVAILLGVRPSLVALAINAATLIIVGLLLKYGYLPWGYPTINPVDKWIVIVLNFLLINSIVTLSIAMLSDGIQDSLVRQQAMLASLEESEKKYRTLIELAQEGIWAIDQQEKTSFVNPSMASMLGYTLEEMVGKAPFEFMDQTGRELARAHLESLRQGRRGQYNFELIHKDGHHIYTTMVTAPILNVDGTYGGSIAGVIDITENKKLQDEKARIERQYQQAQKMESIGTLAGGIAHDFNNMLFPIIGHAELVLGDLPADNPLRNSISEIHAAAIQAKDLVKQILTFSRQGHSEKKIFKIQPLIDESLKLLRSMIPATIRIEPAIEPDPLIIRADPTQIRQIFMNLATNAYHAMEETGGILTVSLQKVTIDRPVLISPDMQAGTYACLTVADTGPGITAEVKANIFDPFFTTKEQGKGTGLGLSVVHGAVKSIGGEVQVDSVENQGATFRIYLPVEEGLATSTESPTVEALEGGTERILIVDDEEAIVFMEKELLQRLGYTVTARTSSVDALEAFRANPNKFDLVITDMSMPGMSGSRLAAELIKIRPDIPILLCTGFSERIPQASALNSGIRGFLMKPIVTQKLAGKIRELLGSRN